MGLRDAIPGLKAHDTIVAPAAPVFVSFDNETAGSIVRAAVVDVNASFPGADVWAWLVATRPDVISELKRFGKDMSLAYLNQDMAAVKSAADRYVRAHLRAWKLFEDRPPVIERQDALFEEPN
jgi:hypothetical protein